MIPIGFFAAVAWMSGIPKWEAELEEVARHLAEGTSYSWGNTRRATATAAARRAAWRFGRRK